MKKLFTLLLIFSICRVTVVAQEDSVTLKDLEIPNAPGFILLDQAPTSIERPNSSKAFIVSVVNSLSENKGLPQNYAVELTPFWFFKHPQMTALKYMGYDILTNKQLIFNNVKKSSLSFAYVSKTANSAISAVNNLSFGLRTNIIALKSKTDISDLRAANKKLIEKLKAQQDRLVSYVGDLSLAVDNPTLYDKKVREFYAEEELKNKGDKNEILAILKRRAIVALDGAIAYNTFFLGNNYSAQHFGRFGAWLTFNYSPLLSKRGKEEVYLNVYVIGRYLSEGAVMINNNYVRANYYDAGVKLEFECKKISIAYEHIFRSDSKVVTFRSNGILKYKISDQLYLTSAFGKNFGSSNNLIALLGLNLGLSSGTETSKITKE